MANSNTANITPPEATMPGLADIVEPALANDWYLAPGWSILSGILLALVAYGGYRWWRYVEHQKPIRYALAELAKLDLTQSHAPEQITTLLKRLIITKAPTHPAVTLSGTAWQQYLVATLPANVKTADPLPDLLTLHYQGTPAIEDVRRYASFAALWLKKAKLSHSGASDA